MKNILNNPWVVGGLCVAALVVIFVRVVFPLWGSSVQAKPASSQTAPNMEQVVAMLEAMTETKKGKGSAEQAGTHLIQELVGWADSFPRDPFRPLPAKPTKKKILTAKPTKKKILTQVSRFKKLPEPASSRLQLQSVAMEGSQRIAMINREVVLEGDRVEEFFVLQIQADGVWVKGPGGKELLAFDAIENNADTLDIP